MGEYSIDEIVGSSPIRGLGDTRFLGNALALIVGDVPVSHREIRC